MSANAVLPITTYFRVCDGVRVRFADNRSRLGHHRVAAGAVARKPVGLPSHLAPRRVSRAGGRHRHAEIRPLRRTTGTDRRGRLGSVSGRANRRSRDGDSARRRPGRRHGRSALPAKALERVTSLTVGGGAVRFPIEAGGALKDIIEAPSLDAVRGLDARTNIGYAVESAAASESEPDVHEDYVSAYDLGRFAESARFCGITPSRTRRCATCCRRSPRRPRSSPGATMTSCRGRTTSTSTTSSPTARSIPSTPVTSRGSKQRRITAAWSSIGSRAGIDVSERASGWMNRVVGPADRVFFMGHF